MAGNKRNNRVVVAMSGGVDSTVAAAVLKDRGFEVLGVTMQVTPSSNNGSAARLSDAKKAARKLKIAHYTVNFRDIFKEKVIADFCAEYSRGRTPNPCIRCNRYIKFGALMKEMVKLGADYIATGHYARICFDRRKKRPVLKKGKDCRKDQSYFLYMLKERQMEKLLMPLGGLTKEEVKRIARQKGLPAAGGAESQEICFIPGNNYAEFLNKYVPCRPQPGPIIDKQGDVIGEHRGIGLYTIGQRRGIGIADKHALYVTCIDRRKNTIQVGPKEAVYRKELVAENTSFIWGKELKAPFKASVKVRYQHPAASATIIPEGRAKVRVKFRRPQWAVAPGQAAVFFKRDTVIGGGTISSN